MATRTAPAERHRAQSDNLKRWLLFAVPLVALAIAVAAGTVSDLDNRPAADGSAAPDFVLPTTEGGEVALSDVLAQGPALTYFSMGVGCDGCFTQIPEIDEALAERGIELVPIMVDPAEPLAHEAARLGVERPILVDEDRTVSEAYGMLGQFGHGDQPSHSFALVDADGAIEQVKHYAKMFVPRDELLDDLDLS